MSKDSTSPTVRSGSVTNWSRAIGVATPASAWAVPSVAVGAVLAGGRTVISATPATLCPFWSSARYEKLPMPTNPGSGVKRTFITPVLLSSTSTVPPRMPSQQANVSSSLSASVAWLASGRSMAVWNSVSAASGADDRCHVVEDDDRDLCGRRQPVDVGDRVPEADRVVGRGDVQRAVGGDRQQGIVAGDGEVGDAAVGVGVVGEHVHGDALAAGERAGDVVDRDRRDGNVGLDDLDRHERPIGAAPAVGDLVGERHGLGGSRPGEGEGRLEADSRRTDRWRRRPSRSRRRRSTAGRRRGRSRC